MTISKTILISLVGALAACGTSAQPTPIAPALIAASPVPALDASTDAKLKAALAGAHRDERERARDKYRHPAETLAAFGLRDSMTVVELWAGWGWYTGVLAPVLAENGKLIEPHFDPNGPPKSEDTQEAKALLARLDSKPDIYGKVVRQPMTPGNFVFGPDGSADMAVTFRSVHNWIDEGYADKVFAATFKVLKSGGILGVVEHRGKPGMTIKQMKDTGYVPEDYVIKLAEAAGFKLAARFEVNANPNDTTDHPNGVWALPPVLANKDKDREKYIAIGESDRMTLRFVKP